MDVKFIALLILLISNIYPISSSTIDPTYEELQGYFLYKQGMKAYELKNYYIATSYFKQSYDYYMTATKYSTGTDIQYNSNKAQESWNMMLKSNTMAGQPNADTSQPSSWVQLFKQIGTVWSMLFKAFSGTLEQTPPQYTLVYSTAGGIWQVPTSQLQCLEYSSWIKYKDGKYITDISQDVWLAIKDKGC